VASFVIENRRLSGKQAEERVERQAREFELLKPYLLRHWDEAAAHGKAAATDGAAAAHGEEAAEGGASAGAKAPKP
jgi:hypothetical protein